MAIPLVVILMPSLGFGFAFDTDRTSLGIPSRNSVYPRLATGGDRIHALWAGPFGLTSCASAAAAAGGRKVTFAPAAGGTFTRTIKLTAAELSAQALYVRAQTSVRRGARSPAVIRTFSLTRAVALR